MAKKNSVVKATHAVGRQGRGQTFEQHESYDDSLLPDAEELHKLKELDPDVINWIKSMTEKEQSARHDFNDRRMGVLEKGQRRGYYLDMSAIFCSLIVILSGMVFSAFLIEKDNLVLGSIFGGATIIFAANSFLNFRKKNQSPPAKK